MNDHWYHFPREGTKMLFIEEDLFGPLSKQNHILHYDNSVSELAVIELNSGGFGPGPSCILYGPPCNWVAI